MAIVDIPFMEMDSHAPCNERDWNTLALSKIESKEWAKAEEVQHLEGWLSQVQASQQPAYQIWSWISTSRYAPDWDTLTTNKVKEWLRVWINFLRMSDEQWNNARPMESDRPEVYWTRLLRQVMSTKDAQPMYNFWHERQYPANTFWKAALATFSSLPTIASTLQECWIQELKHHKAEPGLLFAWAPLVAITTSHVPTEFTSWLYQLMLNDAPASRLLQLRQGCVSSEWTDAIYKSTLQGIFAQSHKPPYSPVPTHVHTLWNTVNECSYDARLSIAQSLLEMPYLDDACSRWPLNYQEMTRTVESAAKHIDIRQWGTAPWLAATLHIIPEFAKLVLLHDLLPITPVQLHDLVLTYRNKIDFPVSAELFSNLDVSCP